jgi:hypothetical protein
MTVRISAIALALALGVPACNVITSDLLGSRDAGDRDAAIDATSDQPEPGLILRYAFEDSGTAVADISGRDKDGVASDTTVWTADGRLGRGLALGGTQSVALPSGVLAGVDDFTIATWVKVNINNDWARIYDFGNDAGDRFMYLTISGYEIGTTIMDGIHASSFGGSPANENVFGTRTLLPTSVWKHLALTGSGGDRRLYIDGFPAGGIMGGPNVPPREMEPTAPKSWLGKSRFVDPGLNGTLDDFRVYDRVLTPSAIADLAWPARDYSHWRFDETTGTTAKDSSDHAIPTTLTAGVTWVTGRLGGAVRLAGAPPGTSGPHLALGGSPVASCTELTVAVWVRLPVLESSRIFDLGTGAGTFMYLSPSNGTGMQFAMASTGQGSFSLVSDSLPAIGDDLWHHVAVTLGSGRATMYVDGTALKNQTGWTIRPVDLGATTENWLGRSRSGDRFLNGALDELRIACRAFTADEIKNLSRR